ncbi:MAG: helix-turn-helix domain-containing protein [Mangrovibacterium sp.]
MNFYKCTHTSCVNLNKHSNPPVTLKNFYSAERYKYYAETNEIIFIIDGVIDLTFNNTQETIAQKDLAFFLCSGSFFSFDVVKDASFIIFKLENIVQFFEPSSLSSLKNYVNQNPELVNSNRNTKYTWIPIHERLLSSITDLKQYLNDRLDCHIFLKNRIKEFFLRINTYYPPEVVYNFFRLITNEDINFSEYVRTNWMKYPSTNDMAESLNMTPKSFVAAFKKTFNTTPYRWFKLQRSKIIHYQLISSQKPIKEIAFNNGFNTLSQFSKFCTAEIGSSPSEIRKSQSDFRRILPEHRFSKAASKYSTRN